MATESAPLRLPDDIYDKLQELATAEGREPTEIISQLITVAHQQRSWLRDLAALREEIRQEGGLSVGVTQEEVVERLRQTRREIFEAEYAHLYR